MDFVYFIVLVGVLIFVHELGHFVWAKFFGVRVLKFSLGFGPRLLGFTAGGTEYVIAAIPLGGYVKMLGESANEVIPEAEQERAFHSQPLFKRVIIVFAGPAMNLVFPIALFFLVFLGDTSLPPPIIGTVFPERPAQDKLLPGDRVISVDGTEVVTFNDVQRIVSESSERPLTFVVQRGDEQVTTTIVPALTHVTRELDLVDEVGRIGIAPYQPTPVVGVRSPSSPAGAARMRPFDVVTAVSGHRVRTWLELTELFAQNRGTSVPVSYLRPVRVENALGGLCEIDVYEPHVATLTPDPGAGSGVERAGLEPADLYVSHVVVGSPAQRTGIRPGDRIVALDGRPMQAWATFERDLKAGGGRTHALTVRRDDRDVTMPFALRHERGVNEHGQTYDRFVAGIRNWVPMYWPEGVDNPSPVAYAAREAFRSTWEMVELTVFSVVRLFQGRVTVKSIGGPITIFEAAGTAAREGTVNFLEVMAFISVNLGLINLLPIPLLDGGHLLFFFAEAVGRRRVSTRVRQLASLAGLSVLILLMVLAFKNDIERKWPEIVATFQDE